jgi:hypothetical protein
LFEHDVHVGMRGHQGERIRARAVNRRQPSAERPADFVHGGARRHGHGPGLVSRHLRGKRARVAAGRKGDDLNAIGMGIGHRQRARADRARRAQDGDSFLAHANR